MTAAAPSKKLHLDGPITRDRLRAWHNAYVSSPLADAVWFPEQLSSFHGRFRRRTMQDLVFIDVESDPFGSRWGRDSPGAAYVGVSVNTRRFSERVLFEDRREFVSTSALDVWDAAGLVEAEILTPMAQTILLVPKSALGLSRGRSLIMREALTEQDRATLRLLRTVILAIAADADRFGSVTISAARNSIIELLLSVVQDRCPPSGAAVSESMRISVIRWVDEHLYLGQLAPAQAAEQHGISVRSLHRLFADSGDSFGSLVRRRRLERALLHLLQTDDRVQSIAMRWGYADASQFIHEFKRVHGTTPAAYRKTRRTPA